MQILQYQLADAESWNNLNEENNIDKTIDNFSKGILANNMELPKGKILGFFILENKKIIKKWGNRKTFTSIIPPIYI